MPSRFLFVTVPPRFSTLNSVGNIKGVHMGNVIHFHEYRFRVDAELREFEEYFEEVTEGLEGREKLEAAVEALSEEELRRYEALLAQYDLLTCWGAVDQRLGEARRLSGVV